MARYESIRLEYNFSSISISNISANIINHTQMMYYDFILSDFREIVTNSLTTLFWYTIK